MQYIFDILKLITNVIYFFYKHIIYHSNYGDYNNLLRVVLSYQKYIVGLT